MGKKKPKWYVVWKGRNPGVYRTWGECQRQINGFAGARYKAFPTQTEAKTALEGDPSEYIGIQASKKAPTPSRPPGELPQEVVLPSWSVDAACSGNPGIMEYRGVDTETGDVLFLKGPFAPATNNIGEFLAIVHALALLHRQNDARPVYTDSRTAMAWVRNVRVRTTLEKTSANAELFALIKRAETWLHNHLFSNPILKWKTEEWGEIPADFGRK